MRWIPKSVPFFVVVIALYLALYFGIEAVRIFTSPVYGLEHSDFANAVRGIERYLTLHSVNAFQIAAFIGALKLAIALLFAIHLVGRLRPSLNFKADHDIVDAAVVLVVIVTVGAAIPALFEGVADPLERYRLPLWMTGLVATLGLIERAVSEDEERLRERQRRIMFRPAYEPGEVALPRKRYGVSSLRWDVLRRSANVSAIQV